MTLRSKLLASDSKLQACAVDDTAHVVAGARGDHVSRLQSALFIADDVSVDASELQSKLYGPSTASAVLAFKQERGIINHAYQSQADDIVGKMTIAALDREVFLVEISVPLDNPNDIDRV